MVGKAKPKSGAGPTGAGRNSGPAPVFLVCERAAPGRRAGSINLFGIGDEHGAHPVLYIELPPWMLRVAKAQGMRVEAHGMDDETVARTALLMDWRPSLLPAAYSRVTYDLPKMPTGGWEVRLMIGDALAAAQVIVAGVPHE